MLRGFEKFETKAQAKKNLVQAIEAVASRLGNTPAICRKCYIHPIVMESYLAGQTVEQIQAKADATLAGGLTNLNAEEKAVLTFLKKRLRQNQAQEKRKGGLLQQLKSSVERSRKKSAARR